MLNSASIPERRSETCQPAWLALATLVVSGIVCVCVCVCVFVCVCVCSVCVCIQVLGFKLGAIA